MLCGGDEYEVVDVVLCGCGVCCCDGSGVVVMDEL